MPRISASNAADAGVDLAFGLRLGDQPVRCMSQRLSNGRSWRSSASVTQPASTCAGVNCSVTAGARRPERCHHPSWTGTRALVALRLLAVVPHLGHTLAARPARTTSPATAPYWVPFTDSWNCGGAGVVYCGCGVLLLGVLLGWHADDGLACRGTRPG